MKLYLTLILLLPLLGAAINAIAGKLLPRRVSETLACGVIWGAFVASLFASAGYHGAVRIELMEWLSSFDFHAPVSLYLDPLSLVMTVMVTFVCALIHTYSVAYMAEEEDYVRYFALLNLFVFAMLTLVLAENLPLLYLGWEGVGFCSYGLIGFWYSDEANATAGRKAFIVTRIGDTAFGIAVIWMFKLMGTVSITALNGMGSTLSMAEITGIGILLLIGAMGKSAQMPLMVWLPDAMAGPTPVSALIHAATMVTAGVYLLARMFPLISPSTTAMAAIALTGGVTAFYGATCAMAQRDLKRALAYSTISQIGYMILGVGVGAVTAATFHLLIHAFFKALLFLGAGCVIAAMHHEQNMFRMGGLFKRLPLTFWTFLAGGACLAGIPLTGGFFSKDSILMAVWLKGGALYGGLYLLALFTALLTSVYTFRMVYIVFGGDRPYPERAEPTHGPGVPRLMEIILVPLALLGIMGGLINLPSYLGTGWLGEFFETLPGGRGAEASHSLEIALQVVAGIVSLAGLAIARYRYAGGRRREVIASARSEATGFEAFFLKGWRFDDFYNLIFVRPFETLASFLWRRIDEGTINGSLDRLASLIGRSGEGLGAWTNGRVSVYIVSFAAGAAILLAYLALLY